MSLTYPASGLRSLVATPPPVGTIAHHREFGAAAMLRLEIWLLVLIPARMVVAPLGGVGTPANLLGVALFFIWVATMLSTRMHVSQTCVPLRVVLGALWLTTLISYLAALLRAPLPSDQMANSDRYLILLAAFSGIALTAAEGLRSRDELLSVLRTLVHAMAVLAGIGILQFRPGWDASDYLVKIPGLSQNGVLASESRNGFNRPAGTTFHPIEFGVVIALALAFAIYVAAYDTRTVRWRSYVSFGLIALAVPLSISRSALLVATCILAYFFMSAPTVLRLRALIVAPGVLAAVFLGVPGLLGTLSQLIFAGGSDSSISTRTSDYAAVAHYLRDSPWIGRGPGTFLPSLRVVDNQYLMSLIEVGLIGTIALTAVLLAPTFFGLAARRRSTNDGDRFLGLMFAAAGMGATVSAATYDTLSFPTFTTMTALLLGLSASLWCFGRAADVGGGVRD